MSPFEPDKIESSGQRDVLVPFVFLVLAGLMLALPIHLQQQISTALRGSVLAPFVWTQEWLQQARVRAGDIEALQAQLDSAVVVVVSQRTLLEENLRLRALLDLQGRMGSGFLAASAIHPGTRGSESMFLLDVGQEGGVAVNDPVVMYEGLVGVVREVGTHTALAMDWTHPDFRVSAMTEDGEVFGIVEPRRGAFREEDRLLLNGVPYHTPVDDGTLIVTSGRGSVYPRGILVGRVAGLAETEAGWRRSYWLEPAVQPGRAAHVLVLTGHQVTSDDPARLEHLWIPEAGFGVPDDGGVDSGDGSEDAADFEESAQPNSEGLGP